VQAFLDDHVRSLPDISTGAARKRLDTLVAELQSHVREQASSNFASMGATKRVRALRRALLRDHMAPIARVARADLPNSIELQPLKMPRGNTGIGKLAAIAYGMAKAAEPLAAVFLLAGLAPDFIDRLVRAADALQHAGKDRMRSRGRRGGATRGLATRISTARKIVHIIDALIQSAAAHDPALLADWNIIKRARRVPRSAAEESIQFVAGDVHSRVAG
jgi:hypothetical protein